MTELQLLRCCVKLFIPIGFLAISFSTTAQREVSGMVRDSISNQRLQFVNMGIRHTNVGTRSSPDGLFSLTIPQQYENDTLIFSMTGYEEHRVLIKQLQSVQSALVLLKQKTNRLPDVQVSAKRLVEKKFGIANSKSLMHFTDGIVESSNFLEIAQVMRLDNVLSKITSVNLYINSSNNDSATFRINFYRFDGHRPAQQLVEKNIVRTLPVKAGWLTFDLSSYDIYLKGDVVVSIELIPAKPNPERIQYEVKLGGSSKSFLKTSSMGDWAVPPHHFRLFVTALVESDREARRDQSDEDETSATARMYSAFVKDSFSIFVDLPKGYDRNKNKSYPTLYLLDANAYQDIVIHAARLLRKENKMADMILVGIGYKNVRVMDSLRNRDYTFPKAMPADSFPISGGADNFLTFIEKELIPDIDTRYRTDATNRTIMGHSLGGYFALFAYDIESQREDKFFKNYVAASPSLAYGNEYIVKQFQQPIKINQGTLLITMGEREGQNDAGTGFHDFVQSLEDLKLNVRSILFPNYGHMETAVPTFEMGLELIFPQAK